MSRPDSLQRCLVPNFGNLHTAGIREARQNLSALLERVKKGQVITITDHGKPVARLTAAIVAPGCGLPDLSAFRRSITMSPASGVRLTELILEERNERT